VYERYKEDGYRRGIKVITTITKADQEAAYAAVRRAVLDYERRHGYRGATRYVNLSGSAADKEAALDDALQDVADSDDLAAAVVLEANPHLVRAYLRGGETVSISGAGLKFAQPMIGNRAAGAKGIRRGAVIYLQRGEHGQWSIGQMPEVEAAFVAARPVDGAVRALVGGFDFNRAKFNHVTQAWRQPGSSIKPFLYSAALERGYTPDTMVDDKPLVIPAAEMGGVAWEPKDYEDTYEGSMPLHTALAKSKNVVAVSVVRQIGTRYARDYLARFGLDPHRQPATLMMALGAGAVTPWQMLGGYAVFANGGYRVEPYVIKQIIDGNGKELMAERPALAGNGLRFIDGLGGVAAARAIDGRNAAQMDGMMRDVIKSGTATRALKLNRGDLAGKTGTTNDYVDAWFCGYQSNLVGIAWIGFDKPKTLGHGETGGAAALPIWMDYMGTALARYPDATSGLPMQAAARDGKQG
jgi:penicillin-binding protein 1A